MKESDKKNSTGKGEPIIRTRPEHNVSRKNICDCALKVIYRLQRSGHESYLVGGGVRDLLLGKTPKDFDVSTDARPGQIKKLFRNCWLIGRRFRLAHIKFGDITIETSTFRSPPREEGEDGDDEDLLVRDDNNFGTPEEDAFRRDFTVNGLFYDPHTFHVIDYVGGLEDIEKKLIRTIGDPEVRFLEDPVRMLRAVRFAARLGFRIEEKTYQALLDNISEIDKASRPRLVEDVYKLFAYGAATSSFKLLKKTGLLEHLLPTVAEYLDNCKGEECERFWQYLNAADKINKSNESVNLPLTFAMMLYPLARRECLSSEKLKNNSLSPVVKGVVDKMADTLTFPRRLREDIRQILTAQDRLGAKKRRRYNRTHFMNRPYFDDAMTLFATATEIEGYDPERLEHWRKRLAELREKSSAANTEKEDAQTQEGNDENQQSSRRSGRKRRRSRRSRKKKTSVKESQAQSSSPENNGDAPPDAEKATQEKAKEPVNAEANSGENQPAKKKGRRRGSRSKKKASAKSETTEKQNSKPEKKTAAKENSADSDSEKKKNDKKSTEESDNPESAGKEGESKDRKKNNRKQGSRTRRQRSNILMQQRHDPEIKAILTEKEAEETPFWLDEI